MTKSSTLVQIQCVINGAARRLEFDSSARLLDVLRENLRLTGTKEGCGKGECGACTVILDGRTVDSCLVMGYQAHGSEIWTIEGLPRLWERQRSVAAKSKGPAKPVGESFLHPVQKAFVECGSSQCGICIPGMIVSTADLLARNPNPSEAEIRYGLAGNLCRCTGYSKIFEAAKRAAAEIEDATVSRRSSSPKIYVTHLPRRAGHGHASGGHVAATLRGALAILSHRGQKRQLAGGTDALVRAKDGLISPVEMFDIFKIPEMRGIRRLRGNSKRFRHIGLKIDGEIRIGAATTFSEVLESSLLDRFAPALVEACAVVGGPQIRNRGTLGGNLANASPAADSVPALMSLGAVLEIASSRGKREVRVEEFFLGPGKTVLKKDELIVGVRIPMMQKVQGCYLRLGQRQAQAISKVDVAVTAVMKSGGVARAAAGGAAFEYLAICYGSVAPTIFRAKQTERILKTGPWDADTMARAKQAIKEEVRPIDDIRSTSEYRREMSAVLLERALRKVCPTARF